MSAMPFIELPLHESEAIATAAYDKVRAILRITFKSDADREGGTYDYLEVPPEVVDELLAAESHGQFVNWKIKPHYQCRLVVN